MATQVPATAQFKRERLTVNGVPIVMLTAGTGEPLVFFHGAGTFSGFDFALPWASRCRVMIPYHPGWGESGDGPEMNTVADYMLHYLELFDQLGLDQVNLVGISMGGRFAATFAVEHGERLRKLVLCCPAGMVVPEHPMTDLSKVPPEEIFKYLVHDFSVIAHHLPAGPDPAFQAVRAREGASFAQLLQSGIVGTKLPRWLHRIRIPTLIVWGEEDRIIPVGQAAMWAKLIPNARIHRVPGAGHLMLDEKPESVEAIAKFLAE
jgi:pimeloyl-ACP methyl ester carboxylesterase